MEFNSYLWIVMLVFASLNLCVIGLILIVKKLFRRRVKNLYSGRSIFIRAIRENDAGLLYSEYTKNKKKFLYHYMCIADQMYIDESLHSRLLSSFSLDKLYNNYILQLSSRFRFRRYTAVQKLAFFPFADVKSALRQLYFREKSLYIVFAVIYALVKIEDEHLIAIVLDIIKNHDKWVSEKVLKQVEPLCFNWLNWAEDETKSSREVQILKLHIASSAAASNRLRDFVLQCISSEDPYIQKKAVECVEHSFAKELSRPVLRKSNIALVQKSVLASIASRESTYDSEYFSQAFQNHELFYPAVEALKKIFKKDANLYDRILNDFLQAKPKTVQDAYGLVLLDKIEFILSNSRDEDEDIVSELLKTWTDLEHYGECINFLNMNKNRAVEDRILPLVKTVMTNNKKFKKACILHLDKTVRQRWRIVHVEEEAVATLELHTSKGRFFLFGLMMLTILAFPVYFFVSEFLIKANPLPSLALVPYLIRFNYFFGFYALILNSSYLLLLLLSLVNLIRQSVYWEATPLSFLYAPRVLPSISILAPAYNEEASIVESVYSLLNLRYPNAEVIVVNDGSKDSTIDELIKQFRLRRVEKNIKTELDSSSVVGIYQSMDYPSLLVVDKLNGGKADALNVGINYASSDYLCSIDADSLLEPDALLKIMFQQIIDDTEIIAVGGNILPVNGCIVEKGSLNEIHVSRKPLVRFQLLEYLRSFVAGRLGWAYLNSLLIISGAFGVFKRKRVLEIGGYMTKSGDLKRDTVGEDMELVVRLIRHSGEEKKKTKVAYAYNANCWTEVPEDFHSLYKQRFRWHRGLLETMTYHKGMFGRARYRGAGLLAFPYFYVFEILGPLFESMGYIVFFVSLFLGILNAELAVFLFFSVILYGVFISISSILFAENDTVYFSLKELFHLLFTAVIENFGFRQLLSLLRSVFFIRYVFGKQHGWQKLKRKGFQSKD